MVLKNTQQEVLKIKSHKKMKTNKNSCSVYVTFVRCMEPTTVELNGLKAATEYITDVILKNNWKFIGMTRGMEYKDETDDLTDIQKEVLETLKKDAEFYGEDNQFTIEASHFRLSYSLVRTTIIELEAKGLIEIFPKRSCYFDGQIK